MISISQMKMKHLFLLIVIILILLLSAYSLLRKQAPSKKQNVSIPSPQIALLRCDVTIPTNGIRVIEGYVKNLTDHKFDDIRVFVNWYTDNGEFIKSGRGKAEYRPLMAGQQCKFIAIAEDNPAMSQYRIQFRDAENNWIIPHEDRTSQYYPTKDPNNKRLP